MRRYAIIGFPLTHSFSPFIHNRAFADLKLPAHYEKIEIEPAAFERQIKQLKLSEVAGFNVTIPFKERILPFIETLSPEAQKIGAVNTVKKVGEQWHGFNTDWQGFLKPLEKVSKDIEHCLVIGAGGAARAVLFALTQLPNLRRVLVANRTVKRAQQLVKEMLNDSLQTTVIPIEALSHLQEKFDLIVNTTPVGMSGHAHGILPEAANLATSRAVVYDLVYNPLKTDWLKQAENQGLATINGLPMLIFQAEAAFTIWTGKRFLPETKAFLFQELPKAIVAQTQR